MSDSKFKHCRTQQCFDSAGMMCDHESYLATQYYLDQTKNFFAQFKPQDPSKQFSGLDVLEFDRGMFNQDYSRDLCKPEISLERCANARANKNPQPPNKKLQRLDGFYVTPCSKPTYTNALACDQKQCCSRSHQLFGNHTRASTGTSY